MSGDPSKVDFWTNADVFVTTNLAAATPTTANDPFSVDWLQTGILDGAEGFTASFDEDSTKHYGWGVYIGERYRNYSESRTFMALENNDTTRAMRYPGSAAGEIKAPDRSILYRVGFEKREGARVDRLITPYRAQIALDGDVSENEEDPAGMTFKVTPIADPATERFYIVQSTAEAPTLTALAITPDPLALTTTTIKKLVATATYSDSSTRDVSASAVWLSATPAKATVAFGYVSGVATGTSVISAMYGTASDSVVATVS